MPAVLNAPAADASLVGLHQKLVVLLNDPALTEKERAKGGVFRLKQPPREKLQACIRNAAALIALRREITGPMEVRERRAYMKQLNDSQP